MIAITKSEKQLIWAFKAISDETRFKIFKLLLQEQELCVSNIANRLGVSVSAVSQHFRLFEQAGLVDKNRYGQKICYVLRQNDRLVAELIRIAG